MSNDAFRARLAELAGRAGDKAEQVMRVVCLRLATAVVMRSPVDTGRFRSNWQYGNGVMNTETTFDLDKSGAITLGRIGNALASWTPGQTIYITNSLPYARPLEYGHSKLQAPGGMVRVTVAEFSQHLGGAMRAIA